MGMLHVICWRDRSNLLACAIDLALRIGVGVISPSYRLGPLQPMVAPTAGCNLLGMCQT